METVTYTVYFTAKFSVPLKTYGIWDKDRVFEGKQTYEGNNVGFYVEFPTEKDQQVMLKTGISFTSREGARLSLSHDIPGLAVLMEEDYFTQGLEAFFDNVPEDFLWNDYYNHPNEPCHHIAFLFNYIGRPWRTQKWTRKICRNAYGTGVRGLCGNEDVGQMSVWYVLAAIGLHPVCPGDNVYQITSPVFSKVSIKLDPAYYPGGTFTVVANNNSEENIYIQSATLNGAEHNRAWITHDEIVDGGTLELKMGPTSNKEWGSAPEYRPPSLSTSQWGKNL